MNKWLWIFFVYPLLPCNHCNYQFTSEQGTSSDDDKALRRKDTLSRARRQETSTTAGRNGSRQRVFTFPNSLSNTVYFGNGDDELTDGEISVSGPHTLWSVNAKSNLRRSPTWYSYNHRVIPSKEPMISHIMKYSADPVGYSKTFVSAMKRAGGLPTDDSPLSINSIPSFGTTIQLEPGNDYHWSTELNIRQSHGDSKMYNLPIDGGVNVATPPVAYAYRYAVKPDDWLKLSPILLPSSLLARGLL